MNKYTFYPHTPRSQEEEAREEHKISIIEYDKEDVREQELDIEAIESELPPKEQTKITWINVPNLHDREVVKRIRERFDFHPLLLEDIQGTWRRPKLEDYEEYLFMVIKMLHSTGGDRIEAEHVSFILGKNYVISFQEREDDVFDKIREKIRKKKGTIREQGADYLFYALLDAIVDNYFTTLEQIGKKIDRIEGRVIEEPSPGTPQAIHRIKRELIHLRRSVWPLQEVTSRLKSLESALLSDAIERYCNEVHLRTTQLFEVISSFQDMLRGIMDLYVSSLSNRMNEIMKVLTIFATIFIPLTFIAGLYGMNFHYMPELTWKWGYFATLLVMLGMGVSMLIYFKKKRWL